MTTPSINGISLFVNVSGRGYPLLLMHGGPGADHHSMLAFRPLADRFNLIFYDHRCNGRSAGPPVTSMTWQNLTADVEALRRALGFARWPEAFVFGFSRLLKGWTVMDRLGEINIPTLVMAGRSDFQFPPEHQEALAGAIPNARPAIIDRAGHNAPLERPKEVIATVRRFFADNDPGPVPGVNQAALDRLRG
jgi:pimeloyl-ACP methyl ester carboxylesterase